MIGYEGVLGVDDAVFLYLDYLPTIINDELGLLHI